MQEVYAGSIEQSIPGGLPLVHVVENSLEHSYGGTQQLRHIRRFSLCWGSFVRTIYSACIQERQSILVQRLLVVSSIIY